MEEAEFYNITPLIKLIKERILERDCKATQVEGHNPFCVSILSNLVWRISSKLVASDWYNVSHVSQASSLFLSPSISFVCNIFLSSTHSLTISTLSPLPLVYSVLDCIYSIYGPRLCTLTCTSFPYILKCSSQSLSHLCPDIHPSFLFPPFLLVCPHGTVCSLLPSHVNCLSLASDPYHDPVFDVPLAQ